ncbi:hypothetical protein BIY24_13600 [Halobacteriovorax marinus]|uniref:hypothetical protein n=1 Tax=Halobacteriovorax marinus TaxID=97084 RepID=UPI000BC33277|nr:hypothetical protein [Halobacteriovorax marinus]ATH08943.1 hypothetical protein BIY24_13600 [Halobacteriovorax marinus]
MKKIYLAITLLILSTSISAKTQALSVRSYLDTEFDAMFELKVLEYPKIILDCQSFFHQLVVYRNNSQSGEKTTFHLDFSQCYEAHEFLSQSQIDRKPICLKLDFDYGEIGLSNEPQEYCK